MQGVCKFWRGESGYGFLAADDGDRDHFIHASVLNRAGFANLVPGQRVKYLVGLNPRNNRDAVTSIELLWRSLVSNFIQTPPVNERILPEPSHI
jgi:cold shock protein